MSDKAPYAGRWVALIGKQVVGVGNTADEAYQSAQHNRPKERVKIRFIEAEDGQTLPFSPILKRIRPLMENEPLPVYLVGGAVRDALLGRVSHDLDFVVPRNAVRLTFQVADLIGAPAYVLDEERDTGRIVLADQDTMLDFACFRDSNLEDDLRARDFTINALAIPATAQSRESIIDPTGGVHDLDEQLIQMTHQSALVDDPVRTLRAVRLAQALGFAISDETQSAVLAAVPFLAKVSDERKRDELLKILMTSRPGNALSQMEALTILPAILPEVAALAGVVQSPPHFEDVLSHTRRVLNWTAQLDEALFSPHQSEDPAISTVYAQLSPYLPRMGEHLQQSIDGGLNGHIILRLAALFHDVGKKETQDFAEDGRIRFFGHDAVGAKLAAKRLRKLCLSKNAISQVKCIVANHMRPLSLAQAQGRNPSRRAVFRYFQATGENGLDIGLLVLADHLATYNGPGDEQVWQTLVGLVARLYQNYFDKHEEAVKPLSLVSGHDLIAILDLKPGPEIGRILRLVQENQAAGEINSREEALQFARQQIL